MKFPSTGEQNSPVWITVNRERKDLTLDYKDCHQGQRDCTLTYSVDNEAELYLNPYPFGTISRSI